MAGYYPQGAAPPHFGHPQQQQQWGAPPQQFAQYPNQYQQPPPQQWGPPQGQQFPPQGPYGQPPMPQQGYQQMQLPPMQNFPQGQPPQQAPPQMQTPGSLPSPGYGGPNDVAQGNANHDVDALMRAMSGIRRDHTTIIRILSVPGPREMALLRQTYAQRNGGQSLESKIDGSFRGHYGNVLLQLVRGPLASDAWNVNRAIKGLGTKEDMLNDVLIGRSNADMYAIKQAYQQIFRKTIESDVEDDLSLKTKTMFQLVMRASRTDESHPYNPNEIAQDVQTLRIAMNGPTTNQEAVYTVLTQRSDNQIRAIALEYQKRFGKPLEDTIRSSFSGHMQDALVLALGRATDRAKSDAYGLEKTMKGIGTYDDLLVNETVRVHWDRQHMDQVKKAYQHFFKRDLVQRVRGETSGDYREALVACYT